MRADSVYVLSGERVPDPDGLFEKSSGKQVRFIKLHTAERLDDARVQALMTEALLRAPVADSTEIMTKGKGPLIIKSISAKQRLRRPTASTTGDSAAKKSGGKAKRAKAPTRKAK